MFVCLFVVSLLSNYLGPKLEIIVCQLKYIHFVFSLLKTQPTQKKEVKYLYIFFINVLLTTTLSGLEMPCSSYIFFCCMLQVFCFCFFFMIVLQNNDGKC